uniref:Uncharacterized protein n=1 Tax=Rhizophora mucronata TaxID=61149 RepID=A0A2P2NKH4_RHIMU
MDSQPYMLYILLSFVTGSWNILAITDG